MRRYTISVDEIKYADIAHWLEQQKNISGAVRALIAQHIAGDAVQPAAQLDLAAIRAVVDAALDDKLSRLSVTAEPVDQSDDALDVFNDLLD